MMIMVAQVFVKCVPTIQPPLPPTQDPTGRQSSMSAVTSRLPRQVAPTLLPNNCHAQIFFPFKLFCHLTLIATTKYFE